MLQGDPFSFLNNFFDPGLSLLFSFFHGVLVFLIFLFQLTPHFVVTFQLFSSVFFHGGIECVFVCGLVEDVAVGHAIVFFV